MTIQVGHDLDCGCTFRDLLLTQPGRCDTCRRTQRPPYRYGEMAVTAAPGERTDINVGCTRCGGVVTLSALVLR